MNKKFNDGSDIKIYEPKNRPRNTADQLNMDDLERDDDENNSEPDEEDARKMRHYVRRQVAEQNQLDEISDDG